MILYLTSKVENHEGPCVPVWVNQNQVCRRIDGGVTGFFRRVRLIFGVPLCKTGKEFHGIIKTGRIVETTELK